MTKDQAVSLVGEVLNKIIKEKGESPCEIQEETLVLGDSLPIDSLDLAAVVIELEEATSFDPFKNGFINFRTVGELAQLYVA